MKVDPSSFILGIFAGIVLSRVAYLIAYIIWGDK